MRMKVRNEIFSHGTIERALDDYRHLLTATVEYGEEYSEIHFLKCKYNEALTARELENYMIGIENL